MTAIADMTILALNDAQTSENKIHSDDVAAKYGFTGALVSGANVFGYLTQPLVSEYGSSCLARSEFTIKFLRPAYHQELLLLRTEILSTDSDKIRFRSGAYNQRDELLAELVTILWRESSPALKPYPAEANTTAPERCEIHWDRINLLQSAPDYLWSPREEDNRTRVEAQRERSAIYQGPNAHIHPYYLLDACNMALKRMFVLPAWIHTGSTLLLAKPVRTGQDIVIRATPTDKWERKGHQFIALAIAMLINDELAAHVEHEAIFRIAP